MDNCMILVFFSFYQPQNKNYLTNMQVGIFNEINKHAVSNKPCRQGKKSKIYQNEQHHYLAPENTQKRLSWNVLNYVLNLSL